MGSMMGSAMWVLVLMVSTMVVVEGRSVRGDADIQRLLHGVMEQLGIARPREEFPAHQAAHVVGPLNIQGGAHEGLQHLGPYGNIPNIVAELTGDNVPKDFSEDHSYPDPPNPCPLGKMAADGCLENSPDTAEFSREFQKHQHLYDPEHDYPALAKWMFQVAQFNVKCSGDGILSGLYHFLEKSLLHSGVFKTISYF